MSLPSDVSCGSPGPLEVHGQRSTALVGEKQRLTFWSNREDGHLHYQWRLLHSPAGSLQRVEQPTGDSTLTKAPCLQVYFDGTVPNFTPELPGRYVFEVRAVESSTGQLALGQAELDVTATAREAWGAGGCSVGAGLPLLVAGLLLLRRVTGPSSR